MDQLQWKKVFEIIADFSIPSPDQNPEVLLADDLEKEFPSDRGLSVMELRENVPYCIFNMREQFYYRNLEEILPREVAPGCKPLSTREREIMEYLIGRESMKDIALKLGISHRTVETHALHIYQKLCVSSRRDLQRFLVH